MPYVCQRTTRVPCIYHSNDDIHALSSSTSQEDSKAHTSKSDSRTGMSQPVDDLHQNSSFRNEVGEGNEVKKVNFCHESRKRTNELNSSVDGPVFCTLEECIARMSLTQPVASNMDGYIEDFPLETNANENCCSSYQTLNISDTDGNTNMSNSTQGENGDDDADSIGDCSLNEDDDYGLGLYHFPRFRNVSDTNNSNSLEDKDTPKVASKKGYRGSEKKAKSSMFNRIKNTLIKRPKYIAATEQLISVDAKRLFFHKNNKGSYKPVTFTITNITDKDLLFKVKKTDHVLHLEPRIGLLSSHGHSSVQVSMVFKRHRSNNVKPDWHQQVMVLVTEVQDAAAISEYSKLLKFWKHLPSREVQQVARIGCQVVMDDGKTLNAEDNGADGDDMEKRQFQEGDDSSLGGLSDGTSIVSYESHDDSLDYSMDMDTDLDVEPTKQVHFKETTSHDSFIGIHVNASVENVETTPPSEKFPEHVPHFDIDEVSLAPANEIDEVSLPRKNEIDFDLELMKIGQQSDEVNLLDLEPALESIDEGFSIDKSLGFSNEITCMRASIELSNEISAAEMGDVVVEKKTETVVAPEVERGGDATPPEDKDAKVEAINNNQGSDADPETTDNDNVVDEDILSELENKECEVTDSQSVNNNAVTIYRSSWGHSPTIPSQKTSRGISPIVYSPKNTPEPVSKKESEDSTLMLSRFSPRLGDKNVFTARNTDDGQQQQVENQKSPPQSGDKFAFHKRESESKKRIEIVTSARVVLNPTEAGEESKSYDFEDTASVIIENVGRNDENIRTTKEVLNDSDQTKYGSEDEDIFFVDSYSTKEDSSIARRVRDYEESLKNDIGSNTSDSLIDSLMHRKSPESVSHGVNTINTINYSETTSQITQGNSRDRRKLRCCDLSIYLLFLCLWLLLLALSFYGTIGQGVCDPRPAIIWDNFGFDMLYDLLVNARNTCG